jgi:hypothetical protein
MLKRKFPRLQHQAAETTRIQEKLEALPPVRPVPLVHVQAVIIK